MIFLLFYLIYIILGFVCAMYTALSFNWNIDFKSNYHPRIFELLCVIFIILLTGPIIPIYHFICRFIGKYIEKNKINKIETDSYNVQIWIGTREGYSKKYHTYKEVQAIVDEIVNEGYCLSITKTEFRYLNGFEPGIIIGLIKYPRFPKTNEEILEKAIEIAKIFKEKFQQERITITAPDKTIMIE